MREKGGVYRNELGGSYLLMVKSRKRSQKDDSSFITSGNSSKEGDKNNPTESERPDTNYQCTNKSFGAQDKGSKEMDNLAAHSKGSVHESQFDVQYNQNEMQPSSAGPIRKRRPHRVAPPVAGTYTPISSPDHATEHQEDFKLLKQKVKLDVNVDRQTCRRPSESDKIMGGNVCLQDNALTETETDGDWRICAKVLQGDEYKTTQMLKPVVPLNESIDIKVTCTLSPVRFYCQLINSHVTALKNKMDSAQYECNK